MSQKTRGSHHRKSRILHLYPVGLIFPTRYAKDASPNAHANRGKVIFATSERVTANSEAIPKFG